MNDVYSERIYYAVRRVVAASCSRRVRGGVPSAVAASAPLLVARVFCSAQLGRATPFGVCV